MPTTPADPQPKGLGGLLLQAGLISKEQLAHALHEQLQTQERLGEILVRRALVSEESILNTLSTQLGVPRFVPGTVTISPEAIAAVPRDVAAKYNVLPLEIRNGEITVAMVDPLNLDALDDLRVITGKTVRPLIGAMHAIKQTREVQYERQAGSQDIESALQQATIILGDDTPSEEELNEEEAKKRSEDAPIINLVNQIISQAVNEGATDIHVEPQDRHLLIRYRVDGLLYDAIRPPRSLYTGVITRIKILSDMDIAERRAPQAGRFSVKTGGEEVDVRVSGIPTIHGEKIVMRLLKKTSFDFRLNSLGFEEGDLKLFREAIRQPYGMVLLSGPTGSGKSTTLYAGIQELRDSTVNIMTVEDPVEYQMPGINQVQVNERKGVTFAAALRTFLRQDPDVMMVGEIRDGETAEIAVRAAMTGHMVFSTIHANDAPSTAVRLVAAGAEPFQAASALTLVAAQRLVRKICPHCVEPAVPSDDMQLIFRLTPQDIAEAQFMHGRGCAECKQRGFRGRIAIVELMTVTKQISELIANKASADAVRTAALAQNMQTLK
ncbi:MAG TPA: GspE/PulE family protein, partial [Candidatus Methylomirabilis sp.]